MLRSIYTGSIYIAYILLRTPSTNDISASRNARKLKKNKLIAFEKPQSRVQSRLCSSNRLEMASKRVKIDISKIDKKT